MSVRKSLSFIIVFAVSVVSFVSTSDSQDNQPPAVDVVVSTRPSLIVQLGHSDNIESVAFSLDGRLVVTCSRDKTARLWDAITGKELRKFEGHSESVFRVAVSPDGRQLLTGSWDKTARLWDIMTGKEIRRFEVGSVVSYVAFSPNGRWLLLGDDTEILRLWDAATGKVLRRFEGHFSEVGIFSPDGRWVLTGSLDKAAHLWDTDTGKEVRKFEGHNGVVTSAAFSPDGRWLLTGSLDKSARLWETASGKEMQRFEGRSDGSKPSDTPCGHAYEHVASVAFLPDKRQVMTWSTDEKVRMWDATTGKELRRLEFPDHCAASVVFSPDGRRVLTGNWNQSLTMSLAPGADRTLRLWDANMGKELCRFEGSPSKEVTSVVFSSDGQQVLVGNWDQTANLWDATTGKELRRFFADTLNDRSGSGADAIIANRDLRFVPHPSFANSVVFSLDGRLALTGSRDELEAPSPPTDGAVALDQTPRLWDTITGKELHRFVGSSLPVYSKSISANGRWVLLTDSWGNKASLWETATEKKVSSFEGHSERVTSIALSPDERWVLTGSNDNTARLWETATGREMRSFEGHSEGITSVVFAADGRSVLTASWDQTARLWDATTGKELRRFVGHSAMVASVMFSPDGRWVLTGSDDNTARLWETATGREMRRFEGHSAHVASGVFSPDGRWVLTGSWDQTSRLWDAATGQEYCSLSSFSDGSWVVTDHQGRFDASDAGNVQGLHWVIANESIDLAQLKDRYYEPGLLAKILGFNKEPLREVSAFTNPKLYPEVVLTDPTPEKQILGIKLKNRGGGIGRVVVKINGKELTGDARHPGSDPNAESLALEVDLRNDPRLRPGESNQIEVHAFEAENYLRSRGIDITFQPRGEKNSSPPDIWGIVAGISDYRGDQIDLRYAAKDAEDFSTGLSIAARRLFGETKVHITTLTTLRQQPSLQPIIGNLRVAFERLLQTKPNDVVIIYLSGHGVNFGGQDGTYYFLTKEAATADLNDGEIQRLSAISSEELASYLTKTPAQKQVLILDTCAAGRFVEQLSERREVPSSQVRALERMKDRAGLHVLAGCASDRASYEATKYSQGLLTHSLLLGMSGAALRDDEYVDVSKLFGFAADQVPQLASGVGGIQRPVIALPKGSSFDVGRIAGDDKSRMPLQRAKPMVLRSSFQEEVDFDDSLGLGKLVDDAMRDVSNSGTVGSVVFVDAREFPSAYRLSGRYRIQGEKVIVDGRLLLLNQPPILFSITGNRTETEKLAGAIRNEVVRLFSSVQ